MIMQVLNMNAQRTSNHINDSRVPATGLERSLGNFQNEVIKGRIGLFTRIVGVE